MIVSLTGGHVIHRAVDLAYAEYCVVSAELDGRMARARREPGGRQSRQVKHSG
jgi:hypothetical protein